MVGQMSERKNQVIDGEVVKTKKVIPAVLTKSDTKEVAVPQSSNLPQSPYLDMANKLVALENVDLDRLERFMELHRSELDRQAEVAFNQSMALVQSSLQPVVANRQNKHTKSLFADLAAVHEAAKPIWTAQGFSVVSRTSRSNIDNHVAVTVEIRHSMGHIVRLEDDWPLDMAGAQGKANKTPIQAKASSITYARRYMECAAFDIAVDNDADGNSDQPKLSSAAEGFIDALRDCSNLNELMHQYKLGYRALEGDGYGRNRLGATKEEMKQKLTGAA